MLQVKGVLTERSMSIPIENVGLIMRMARTEFPEFLDTKYPEFFTRIQLKIQLDFYKFVDCIETPEELAKQLM